MNHRETLGISLSDLVSYTGTTAQKIVDFENGKQSLSDEEIKKYNDFFGITDKNPTPSVDTLCLFALFGLFVRNKKHES